MIHAVFNRPQKSMKIFDSHHTQQFSFEASGDACSNSNGPMPEGHYILLEPELFPQSSWGSDKDDEGVGWGRIRIRDMASSDVDLLVNAGLAIRNPDGTLAIGGVNLAPGNSNSYVRVIEIHGGGSALGYPGAYDANQRLCCTLGCTRMHNGDLKSFVDYMRQNLGDQTFVYSVYGAPPPCDC